MGKLTVSNFQERVDFVKKEHEILEFWDETKAFEQSVTSRPEDKRYVFYDGPPFATGTPHYGHILASTIKDVVPRYWTMKGYRVDRVWGWDCHGIPIENMIEKELGLKGGKKGIEELGIDKFNAACRNAILRFDKEWEQIIRRIGRWVDFKHSYKTMDTSFMESVWWAFKTLYEKELVYEGRKVILYCPRCSTPLSNFEIAMDNSYKDMLGPSTTYKYKIAELPDTYILAWSTTPWNKLATPALAVNPDITYVEVEQGNEHYILAETRLEMLTKTPYKVVKKYTGRQLEQYTFELHYDFYPRLPQEKAGVIIADSYVTDGEGTGVVTLAVYGEDDYRVMNAHNIQKVEHIDSEGKLKPEVTKWAGMFMLKVNPLVNEDLATRGLIYHDEERLHSVPVCYRCETRLYQAPIPAWFIDIQKIKPQLVKQNEKINWYPDHLKHGRFGKGLDTAPDWNISRSRYWGTPMPIWKSEDVSLKSKDKMSQYRIIGSIEELKQWAVDPKRVEKLTDIHREFLDDIDVWVDDKKTLKGKRIPEVFDCWVESGSMPYASIHYPFEHKKLFENTHPAQFIAEYIAQTRAWFYTLHVMSVGLFGSHTFENAVTTGTVLAEDGNKMSKSKKNYPDPALLFEKYGVDALRFYLMSTVVMKAENLNFSEDSVKEAYQKVVSLLWNTFSFYKLYAPLGTPIELPNIPAKEWHILDRWVVSITQSLLRDVTTAMDSYDTVSTCRYIQSFLDQLSTWYLRRSRERLKEDATARQVFGWVLSTVAKVIAPVTPFIAELIWQNLGNESSIHIETWPKVNQSQIDEELETNMVDARSIVTAGHAVRKTANKPLKEQLRELSITIDASRDVTWISRNQEILTVMLEELNILELWINGVVYKTALADISDEELGYRNTTRSIIRKVQQIRKDQSFGVKDKIKLTLPSEYQSLPKSYLDEISKTTVASSILWGDSFAVSMA